MILCSCNAGKEETPIIPPLTSPLSRDYIGFGVITASFTHVTAEPADDSVSMGYLRRGSVVRVLRRQAIRTGGSFVSWVLIEGNQQGWLKEEVLDIYESEGQAKTAAESMSR
ncbi:MAG: hypothetical protein FWC03_04590 [Treponema sp.]|nr:hypothetical protein [Treponema sp.]